MGHSKGTPYRSTDAAEFWSIAEIHQRISPRIGVSRFVDCIPPEQMAVGGPRWKSTTVRDFELLYLEKWTKAGYRCQVTAEEVRQWRSGFDVRINEGVSKE